MPSCHITNETGVPLNISLKQVTALHFENDVRPGSTIKFRAGKVWFTLEAKLDEGPGSSSRYSVMKSAATIALISLAVGGVAVTAGAALLPEAAVVGAGAAAATLAKGLTFTKSALLTHSGTITKVSGLVLPKVVDKVTSQAGGLSELQKEVLSIVSSPTLSSDVRKKSASILRGLYGAHRSDRASKRAGGGKEGGTGEQAGASISELTKEEEEALRELEEFEMVERGEGVGSGGQERAGQAQTAALQEPEKPPTLTLPDKAGDVPPANPSLMDRSKTLFQRRRSGAVPPAAPTTAATAPHTHADVAHGEPSPVQTRDTLRVHRIYVDRRREFSVRTRADGRMELYDRVKGEVIG